MEKTFDFDHFESRLPWGQVKWEPAELEKTFGTQDVLPAWIADMDLKTLPEVQEAIIEAAKNGMYGYTKVTDEVIASYLRWQQRRNGWNAAADWFRFTPGVVTAINLLLLSETEEGDEVLIQRPVYYPFADSIQQQKRVVVNSPLQLRDGRYEIDFADFERKAASPRCRAFVLSNPHNPVGRVYTEEELRRVGEICRRHHVFVIADEIHSDLIFPGHQHIVFASLGQNYAENCAVCHAPSKTFNLAGLSFSCIMIPMRNAGNDLTRCSHGIVVPIRTFLPPLLQRLPGTTGKPGWIHAWLIFRKMTSSFGSLRKILGMETSRSPLWRGPISNGLTSGDWSRMPKNCAKRCCIRPMWRWTKAVCSAQREMDLND